MSILDSYKKKSKRVSSDVKLASLNYITILQKGSPIFDFTAEQRKQMFEADTVEVGYLCSRKNKKVYKDICVVPLISNHFYSIVTNQGRKFVESVKEKPSPVELSKMNLAYEEKYNVLCFNVTDFDQEGVIEECIFSFKSTGLTKAREWFKVMMEGESGNGDGGYMDFAYCIGSELKTSEQDTSQKWHTWTIRKDIPTSKLQSSTQDAIVSWLDDHKDFGASLLGIEPEEKTGGEEKPKKSNAEKSTEEQNKENFI